MPALPTTTAAFASTATEAAFKTFLSEQRNFLAGLLGTDGLPATARAALGVSGVTVTSVNGNSGVVTAAQVLAAVVAALGYTPPNPSGLNADTVDGYHYNNLPYTPTDAINSVGGIRFVEDSLSAGSVYTALWSGIPSPGSWRAISTVPGLADVWQIQRIA